MNPLPILLGAIAVTLVALHYLAGINKALTRLADAAERREGTSR